MKTNSRHLYFFCSSHSKCLRQTFLPRTSMNSRQQAWEPTREQGSDTRCWGRAGIRARGSLHGNSNLLAFSLSFSCKRDKVTRTCSANSWRVIKGNNLFHPSVSIPICCDILYQTNKFSSLKVQWAIRDGRFVSFSRIGEKKKFSGGRTQGTDMIRSAAHSWKPPLGAGADELQPEKGAACTLGLSLLPEQWKRKGLEIPDVKARDSFHNLLQELNNIQGWPSASTGT